MIWKQVPKNVKASFGIQRCFAEILFDRRLGFRRLILIASGSVISFCESTVKRLAFGQFLVNFNLRLHWNLTTLESEIAGNNREAQLFVEVFNVSLQKMFANFRIINSIHSLDNQFGSTPSVN